MMQSIMVEKSIFATLHSEMNLNAARRAKYKLTTEYQTELGRTSNKTVTSQWRSHNNQPCWGNSFMILGNL